MRTCVLSIATVLALAAGVRAEDPPKPRLVTKVFSVADLVIPVPDFVAAGTCDQPKCAETMKKPTPAECAERLIRTVTEMVRPYSWHAMGGTGKAEYHEPGHTLVVNNSPDVVQEVADLLEALRRIQERQLCTEVRVVQLPAGFCDRVGLKASDVPSLTERELKLLVEAAQGDPRANVMQFPKVTTFDGQVATIRNGEQRMFVTGGDITRVKGQAVFVPRNTPVDLGDTLTLCGRTSADGKSLNLRAKLTHTRIDGEVELVPVVTQVTPVFEGGSQGKPVPFTQYLQAPNVKTVAFEKNVTLPSGATVVLGTWTEPAGENGVPMLSKVPYVARLFKNVGPSRGGECEVIVLATARVIDCGEGRCVPRAAPMPRPLAPAVDAGGPERYNSAARAAVLAPFAQQMTNGYIAENTIWNWYFEPGTVKLTKAGAEKLRALATARPAPDSKVYLQTARDECKTIPDVGAAGGRDPVLDAKRAAAVRRYLSTVATGDTAFEVLVIDPAFTPARPIEVTPPASQPRAYPLRRAAAADAGLAVQKFLDGKRLNGRVTYDAPSNTVWFQAEAAVQEQIVKLIAAIDAPVPQVLIEGVVMQAPAGFLADIGLAEDAPAVELSPRERAMFDAHIRHAKGRGGLDILSRPQMQIADNQTGSVQVGQDVPYVAKTGADGKPVIETRPVGLTMRITPRINPEGKVLLRVEPQITTVSPSAVDLGSGKAPAFNVQQMQTTVLTSDGRTVVLKGLKDKKEEVIIILTTHVVRDGDPLPGVVKPAGAVRPVPQPAPNFNTPMLPMVNPRRR